MKTESGDKKEMITPKEIVTLLPIQKSTIIKINFQKKF